MTPACEQIMGPLMEGIIKDLSVEKSTISIVIDFDKPGLPNFVKSTLKSIVKAFTWFYIKIYDIIQDVKKAAKEATTFISNIPKMIEALVKEFISSFLDDLKIPQPNESIFEDFRKWVSALEAPAFIKAAVAFVMSIVKGVKSLPEAIKEAAEAVASASGLDSLASKASALATDAANGARNLVNESASRLASAKARVQRYADAAMSAVNIVKEWVEKTIKFIYFLLSLPALLIKAVFDFVKTSLVKLAS
jgi:methyl-accepting chemotaxis protein